MTIKQDEVLILSDDRVAMLRPILTGDWLAANRAPNFDIGLMLAVTTVDGKQLAYDEMEALPLEDYLLINHGVGQMVKQIMEFVGVFKESK